MKTEVQEDELPWELKRMFSLPRFMLDSILSSLFIGLAIYWIHYGNHYFVSGGHLIIYTWLSRIPLYIVGEYDNIREDEYRGINFFLLFMLTIFIFLMSEDGKHFVSNFIDDIMAFTGLLVSILGVVVCIIIIPAILERITTGWWTWEKEF